MLVVSPYLNSSYAPESEQQKYHGIGTKTHPLMGQSRGPIYKPTQLQPYDLFTKMPNIHSEEKTASSTTSTRKTG